MTAIPETGAIQCCVRLPTSLTLFKCQGPAGGTVAQNTSQPLAKSGGFYNLSWVRITSPSARCLFEV